MMRTRLTIFSLRYNGNFASYTYVQVPLLVVLEAAILHHAMVESNLYKEPYETAYKGYWFSNHQILKQLSDIAFRRQVLNIIIIHARIQIQLIPLIGSKV
jgi:hypothetical protein